MQDPGEGFAKIKDERRKRPSLKVEIIRFRFRIPGLCLRWKQELEKIEARNENGFFCDFGSCCRLALKTGKRGRKLSQEKKTLAFRYAIELKQGDWNQTGKGKLAILGARGDGLHALRDDGSGKLSTDPANKDARSNLRD
jgi:hypothetical protein